MPGFHKLLLPESYRALLDLDASGFAWEWLRRNPEFRALWDRTGEDARRTSARALIAGHRITHMVTRLGPHPLERRTAPWGLTFLAGA